MGIIEGMIELFVSILNTNYNVFFLLGSREMKEGPNSLPDADSTDPKGISKG